MSGPPPGPAGGVRRWRGPLLVVGLVLLGGIAVALAQPARPTAGYLDPGNPGPQGTRALADILGQHGQPVVRAGSVAAARAARDRAATLVITSPYLLTTGQLGSLAAAPGNLMVVEPDGAALAALRRSAAAGPVTGLAGAAQARITRPGCPLPAAVAAGSAVAGGVLIRVSAPGPGQCYRVNGLPSLVRYTSGGRSVTLLGSGVPLSNRGLARRGDAALALNLLRGSPRIIWLVPSLPPPAAPGGTKSLLQEIPGPAYLVALQLFIAAGLAALWRMRRLGPLVTEPLPVVVRAAETVEGHGRLYQSRRSRGRAAAVLRAAAVRRITSRLALPAAADPAAVSAAAAARAGRSPAAVRAILFGPAPRDDRALVTLGRDIDILEEEVRTP